MAYVHNQYEVLMKSRYTPSVGGPTGLEWEGLALATMCLNASTIGLAYYAPMFFPVKVHACGVQVVQSGAAMGAYDLIFRHNPSNTVTAVGSATDNILTIGTTANNFVTAAGNGELRTVYRRVTKNVVVYPGQCVKVLATGMVSDTALRCGLLVSPAWDVPENVTAMVSSVT